MPEPRQSARRHHHPTARRLHATGGVARKRDVVQSTAPARRPDGSYATHVSSYREPGLDAADTVSARRFFVTLVLAVSPVSDAVPVSAEPGAAARCRESVRPSRTGHGADPGSHPVARASARPGPRTAIAAGVRPIELADTDSQQPNADLPSRQTRFQQRGCRLGYLVGHVGRMRQRDGAGEPLRTPPDRAGFLFAPVVECGHGASHIPTDTTRGRSADGTGRCRDAPLVSQRLVL